MAMRYLEEDGKINSDKTLSQFTREVVEWVYFN
jgi:hypothetical protein